MMTAVRRSFGAPLRGLRRASTGLTAIAVKELRGRMRGRRAFVIVTVYLALLAVFALMMALILEQQYAAAFGGSAAYASAQIGRGVFGVLLVLETALVMVLAPAFTAGAISQEREKQTLDLLAATPISSLALVIGKLLSALTYVFVLIFASIPLTAIVFLFGGVFADDVVRAYVVLLGTALGFGALGLFFSALIQRTQAATIATYGAIALITGGAFFVAYFWNAMTGATEASAGNREFGPLKGRPPGELQLLNPYFAQADILCTVEEHFGEWCRRSTFVGARPGGADAIPPTQVDPGAGFGVGHGEPGVVVPDDVVVLDDVSVPRDGLGNRPDPEPHSEVVVGVDEKEVVVPVTSTADRFWPGTVSAWLALSVVLVVASVQLVSPTRRWRPAVPLPARLSRAGRRSNP